MKLKLTVIASLFAALTLTSTSVAYASTDERVAAELDAKAGAFFAQLKGGKAAAAFHDNMADLESWIGSSNVENLSNQTESWIKLSGGIASWRLYSSKTVTEGLVIRTYFVKCKYVPFFFTFQFYNNDTKWSVIDIQLGTYNNQKKANLIE